MDLIEGRAKPDDVPEAQWRSVILSSRLNRLTLLLADKLVVTKSLPPSSVREEFNEAVRKAGSKLDRVREGVRITRELCDANGWEWSAFKTDWHFRKEMSDVDVLVSPKLDLDTLAKGTASIGGAVLEREAHKLKVEIRRESGPGATLDFHTKITQDDLDFFDESRVLRERREGRIEGERAFVASREDSILALCLEAYFGDSVLNLATVLELEARLADPSLDPDRLLNLADARGWGDAARAVLYAAAAVRGSTPPQGISSLPKWKKRALQRRFGGMSHSLPTYFPLAMVTRDLLQKGHQDAKKGDRSASARARHAVRRQAGARLYGIPMKVDGRVEKVP